MKKLFLLAIMMMMVAAAIPLSAEETPQTILPGRYTTQVHQGTLYLIDTMTAEVWWFEHNTWGGYRWTKYNVETPQNQSTDRHPT